MKTKSLSNFPLLILGELHIQKDICRSKYLVFKAAY